MKSLNSSSKTRAWALTGASALVLGVAGIPFAPSMAFAQDDVDAAEEEDEIESDDTIVVTGVRSSLRSAQQIKRSADTVVDSITATDIGAFPDKSIAEALQRVAGITVNRFAASSDTAHFSAEPSGVIVRGLQQVRSEFNGRDTFSANSSRGLSWSDISPELMAGVDTYKNQTAELIEGGIAGTINLRTRVPFDSNGRLIALSANANYNSLAEATTPEISGIFSDRWETEIGEFGIMANAAYSEVQTKSEGLQLYRMNRFGVNYVPDDTGAYSQDRRECGVNFFTADGRQVQYTAPGFAIYDDARCNNNGQIDESDGIFFVPSQIFARDNTYYRERTGVSLAAQWQDPSRKWLATAQYQRSEYDQRWEEYVVFGIPADFSYGQSIFYVVPNQDINADGVSLGDPRPPQPLVGTDPFVFNNDGLFQQGTIVNDTGWWGGDGVAASQFLQNGDGEALVNPCYGWNGCAPRQRGSDVLTESRSNNNTNVTEDFGFNLKYAPTDRLRFNFDAQRVEATVSNYDITAALQTFGNIQLDLTGEYPDMMITPGININYTDGEAAGAANTNAEYQSNTYDGSVFQDPSNYFIKHIMDHIEDSEGTETAFRGDVEYDFVDSGWLRSVKLGARYANREQLIRNSTYNWQNVANNWTNNAQYANPLAGPVASADLYDNVRGRFGADGFLGYGANGVEVRPFGIDLGNTELGNDEWVFFNMDLLQDKDAFAAAYGREAVGGVGNDGHWSPICSGGGERGPNAANPAFREMDGSCYGPGEIADVQEETLAGYMQVNFGGADAELFGIPFSGNIGVRYVETTNSSTGSLIVPTLPDSYFAEYVVATDDDTGDPILDPDTGEETYETTGAILPRTFENLACYRLPPRRDQETGDLSTPPVAFTPGCYVSQDQYNFLSGGNIETTTEKVHEHWLPSFNIKFDLSDEWLIRFAASRAMSRPDMGTLRNYANVGVTVPNSSGDFDPQLYSTDGSGNITGITPIYRGSAQNPFLAPVMANQFDVSLERYFADVGSFSFAVFYKEFEDYIQVGEYEREVTNNGVTDTALIRGPQNGEGAAIKGFEVAYQRFFDFLPSPWDGFGVQANYTYVDNQGISNSRVANDGASGDGENSGQVGGGAENQVQVDRLEGLSDHSYNLVGMYEKGPFAARLAYNWRSEYLITALDCCVATPIWNEEQGFLDASLRYRVNDNVELSVQGQNLLNTKTVTESQVQNSSDGGFRLPGSKFQNDVRYTFGVRMKF